MSKLNRGELLRAGAAGALAAATGAVVPTAARAQGAPPLPQGDDIGFVQWGATAELVCVAYWDRVLAAGRFGTEKRRWIVAMRRADVLHQLALAKVLGPDAPTLDDFAIVFPRGSFSSRARIAALGRDLEEHVTRAYLAAVAGAGDPGTRLLLGRILVQDAHHLDALRSLTGGVSAFAGQTGPLDLEQAGAWLDRHLRVRSS